MQGEATIQDLFEIVMFIKDNAATKDDIAAIRAEMATKDDLTSLRQELKQDIAELRKETKQDIAELRKETKQDIAELRKETKQDIAELRKETKQGIADLRKESKKDSASIRVAMATKDDILWLDEKIEQVRDDMMHHVDGFIGLYKTQEQEMAMLSMRVSRGE